MFKDILNNVKNTVPLVHNITNYVTVNDCANILLACGASPIMADDIEDVRDITKICSALNINIGTLNARTLETMLESGKISNELSHPVILDPVGAGASSFRTEAVKKLLQTVRFSVIKGNISEIKTLFNGIGTTKGVDADEADRISEENLDSAVYLAKKLSEQTGAVIAVTGETDIVADTKKAYIIKNGHSMMGKLSGTGCMLSSIIAAYSSANKDNVTEATAAAVCLMGLCGERAYKRLKEREGNLTYKNLIFDEMYNITGDELEDGAKYEIK